MARPKRIRIGHMTFTVESNLDECDAMASDGHCSPESRRIVVRPGLKLDREQEVVLHESLHAAVAVSGLTYENDADEEALVKALTGPILDLLRRNQQLITFLTSQE